MKILWHSNAPWTPTGYGQTTARFVHRIEDLGHEVAILAYWGLQGGPLEWEGIPIYPSISDAWGNDVVTAFAVHHFRGKRNAGWIITLTDVWVLRAQGLREMHVASWVPIDHDPVPPAVVDYFTRTGAVPIAMAQHGRDAMQRAGLNPMYVPHGIDTKLFAPRDDGQQIRELLGIPTDAFVVGMVAANKGNAPIRKAFPEAFAAFARFAEKRPSAVLYMHTLRSTMHQGADLMALADTFGISDRVIWCDQLAYVLGEIPMSEMSGIYSIMDVLLNPAYGEGFGMPILEAQSCGVPVIIGDNTAMSELCGGGWLVPCEPLWDEPQRSFMFRPRIDEIVSALDKSYHASNAVKKRARDFALTLDTDVVTKTHWTPVLGELEAMLEVPKITPVDIDRVTEALG